MEKKQIKSYKLELCSNKKCKCLNPVEKFTFIAPIGYEIRKRSSNKNVVTGILRFCSIECKSEWLKNEYEREW